MTKSYDTDFWKARPAFCCYYYFLFVYLFVLSRFPSPSLSPGELQPPGIPAQPALINVAQNHVQNPRASSVFEYIDDCACMCLSWKDLERGTQT